MQKGSGWRLPAMQSQTATPAQPHLKRVLSLWDLIYYGIILTSPIAAVPLFGEGQVLSHGHTVATLLLAMVAMSVTASQFRTHGERVSLVRLGLHLYQPGTELACGICGRMGDVFGIFISTGAERTLCSACDSTHDAAHPFCASGSATVGLITLMTVQGIRFTARTNEVLLGFMLLVTTVFLVEAFRYIVLHHSFIRPDFACSRSIILRHSICGR